MDIQAFLKAVSRQRAVAIVGTALAVILAVLSLVSIRPFGDTKLSYRSEQLWSSKIVLQIAAPGFREGAADDPGQQSVLAQLAPLYAQLARSDAVTRRVRARGPLVGKIDTEAVVDSSGRAYLPLVAIYGLAPSKSDATRRARLQATAFVDHMRVQQQANRIPTTKRIGLSIVQANEEPKVATPRKKALPIVVLLAMLVLTAAAVLVLDNTRRSAKAPSEDGDGTAHQPAAQGRAETPGLQDKTTTVTSTRRRGAARTASPDEIAEPAPGSERRASTAAPDATGIRSTAARRPASGSAPWRDNEPAADGGETGAVTAPVARAVSPRRKPES